MFEKIIMTRTLATFWFVSVDCQFTTMRTSPNPTWRKLINFAPWSRHDRHYFSTNFATYIYIKQIAPLSHHVSACFLLSNTAPDRPKRSLALFDQSVYAKNANYCISPFAAETYVSSVCHFEFVSSTMGFFPCRFHGYRSGIRFFWPHRTSPAPRLLIYSAPKPYTLYLCLMLSDGHFCVSASTAAKRWHEKLGPLMSGFKVVV